MRWAVIFVALVFAGCTSTNPRPLQGDIPACSLYALANAVEIQMHTPLSQAERLRVWRGMNRNGVNLPTACTAAVKAGWLPQGSWLQIVPDARVGILFAPLLCALGNHAVTLLSISDGTAIYLDPRYVDPMSMSLSALDAATKGFYWRIILP